jgi:hypothetical protein
MNHPPLQRVGFAIALCLSLHARAWPTDNPFTAQAVQQPPLAFKKTFPTQPLLGKAWRQVEKPVIFAEGSLNINLAAGDLGFVSFDDVRALMPRFPFRTKTLVWLRKNELTIRMVEFASRQTVYHLRLDLWDPTDRTMHFSVAGSADRLNELRRETGNKFVSSLDWIIDQLLPWLDQRDMKKGRFARSPFFSTLKAKIRNLREQGDPRGNFKIDIGLEAPPLPPKTYDAAQFENDLGRSG